MPATPIDFYFDFASPYGYFAAREIDDLAARHGTHAVWRPFLLGAVFKHTGSAPNLAVPLRGAYFKRDVARIARLLDIPLVIPPSAPVRGVTASRAFYWLDGQDGALAKRFALAVYDAHWLEGRDIGQGEELAAVATALGLDPAAMAAGCDLPEIKDRLRQETDEAIARGAFGSPYCIVGDEPFWGWDRLPMLENWLAQGGW